MTYSTGNITGSSTPAADLLALIEADLTAHASWTFVKEVPDTYNRRIWRNDDNDSGITFYLDMRAHPTSHIIYFTTYEVFDEVNDEATRWAYLPNITIYDYSLAATDAPTDANTPTDVTAMPNDHQITVSCNTTDFTYGIWVTRNAVVVGTDGTSYPVFVGTYETLLSHANDYPLALVPLGYGDADGSGSTTRAPGATDFFAGEASTFVLDLMSVTGGITGFGIIDGKVPSGGYARGGQAMGVRLALDASRASISEIIGLYHDMLYFQIDTGVEPGDTIDVGVDTYVFAMQANASYPFFLNTNAA